MVYSSLDIAKYFLSTPEDDSGDLVSNMKLQKLLYYAQGYFVALNGAKAPLFGSKIYAWKHGPVVEDVYHHYCDYKNNPLPKEDAPAFDEDTVSFLDEIYRTFGKYSAWALREMTHREDPWLKNFKPDVRDIEIPLVDLENYFKNKISVS